MFASRGSALRAAALVVLLVGVSGACDSTAEPEWTAVTARVQVEYVAPGYSVPVHLVNRTALDWVVSLCPAELQRLDVGRWRSVQLSDCELGDIAISGGEPLVTSVGLPASSRDGQYRIVFHVWPPFAGAGVAPVEPIRIVSNRFLVPQLR